MKPMCDCISCVRDLGVCLVKDFFDVEESVEQDAPVMRIMSPFADEGGWEGEPF